MGFTIKTVPKGSSNKPQTLVDIGDPKLTQGQSLAKAPTPFIDKISITLKVPTKQEGQVMWSAHLDAVADQQTYVPKGTQGGYNKSYRIALPSVTNAKAWPLYQIGCDGHCITKARIEFVPVDLGPQGMEELHAALFAVMDQGWAYVVEHGRITRLDIAVDFPEVTMDQFHFLPKQGATTTQWKADGSLRTYQHGKTRGSHTSIYDRKAKRIDKKQPWAGKEGIRVERRLKGQQMALSALQSLPCPFNGMNMVKRIMGKPTTEPKAYIWSMFLSAVECKELAPALAELPVAKRTAYRTHYKKHCVDWWNPEALWAGWQAMLNELKIADPTAWN